MKRTVLFFAAVFVCTAMNAQSARALDVVMLVPDMLRYTIGGERALFGFTVNDSAQYDGGCDLYQGWHPILCPVTAALLLPFAIANANATPVQFEQIDKALLEQGYSQQQIDDYNQDWLTKIGPNFNGRYVTMKQYKLELHQLGVHESTLQAMMLK